MKKSPTFGGDGSSLMIRGGGTRPASGPAKRGRPPLGGGLAADTFDAVAEGGGRAAALHLHALEGGPELALEVGVALVEAGGFLEALHGEVEFRFAAVNEAEAVMQVGVLGADLDGHLEGGDGAAAVAELV